MEKSQPNTQEEEAIIACQRHTPKQETREVGMKWIHVIRQARKNQRNELLIACVRSFLEVDSRSSRHGTS